MFSTRNIFHRPAKQVDVIVSLSTPVHNSTSIIIDVKAEFGYLETLVEGVTRCPHPPPPAPHLGRGELEATLGVCCFLFL